MADREKVIKELEYCEEYFNCCDKCPYWDGGTHCTADLAHDALALLKERDAVKPKSKSRHGEYPQIVHRCGNCNEILYRYYKYCPTCGRAVKWE